ncbi:PREDICTED: uncharacterized protein LOC108360143 [Rhagoletis zephyria]|uniref:uncharacterized protein LOC108360143 n=1 Tax=Rhagoletis zephyria TaxID=28612 RepID=UPI000811A8AC|nr:PREDICTED: uncharacterized protein LOC108360143 [Rhagoletis zephyria]XP_036344712.1 uncharacterized protein LOC118753945 [Rhagoletis pomonella]XP_036344713.1 uncharacterized protein LOC118753945 [Rhagoletis pomonella]XP_036344719.1 uncharacterized protein LOC118753953 [Rhagoletis pomonella]XP_036344720.1 uncharacterized protein LOC118753953 [Rhagoletis pomonella]
MTYIKPMAIAIYIGDTKPPLKEYFRQFVDELNDILHRGLCINGHQIKLIIRYFVCDTPARNFIKGTVGFNAAHGCIKCTVVGEFDKKGRHMSFPRIDCPLRTDESFRNKTDQDHHKDDSPLLELPINIVEDVIIADSLHLFFFYYVNWTCKSLKIRTFPLTLCQCTVLAVSQLPKRLQM